MGTQELVQLTPQQELVARVRSEDFKQEVAVLLPPGETVERFARALATAVLENPDLATKAEPASVYRESLKAAADGLLPDGREAALVIFGGKAVYQPMVGGFRKIAAEHGWMLRSAAIYEKDEFEYDDEGIPIHRQMRPGKPKGELVGAFAYAVHRDGRRSQPVVLDREDIEKVRATSRAKDSGPWREWYPQMAEKTAARRAFKKIPIADADRVERVLAATALEPAEATAAMYGPGAAQRAFPANVNPETGELTSGADGAPTDADAADSGVGGQQVAEAAQPDAQSSASPPASAAPGEEPEPTLNAEPGDARAQESLLDTPAHFVVPNVEGIGEAWRGKTFAEIAAIEQTDEYGVKLGEKWLDFVARNPAKYPPELHAALQRFRPQLFSES